MQSAEAAYWLGSAHIVVTVFAMALTPRPVVSVFHIVQLFHFIAFGLRPILAASAGGYTNYPTTVGHDAYNYGLLFELIFVVSFSSAYILFFRLDGTRPRPIVKIPPMRHLLVAFGVGSAAIVALQIMSGGSWLPSVRQGTINVASPGAKYLFPIGLVGLSVVIPGAALAYILKPKVSRVLLAALVLGSLMLTSLLFVRGMVISAFFVVFWGLEKNGRLKAMHLVIALALAFSIGNLLRPIGEAISLHLAPQQRETASIAQRVIERLTLAEKVRAVFLYTTNNDSADSWPVVISYARHYGYREGRTFVAIPARFAGTQFRIRSGILTASDAVNLYHYGDDYVRYSFGFNVSLANELYLNFGPIALLLGVIPGLLTWAADRWLMRLRMVSSSALFIAFIFFAYKFTSEPAANLQWIVGALVVAFMVETAARMRLTRRGEAGATGLCQAPEADPSQG